MATNRSATDLSNLPAAPVAEAALLTPAGRGAIATLRVTGTIDRIDHADPPLFQAVNGRPLRDQPLRRIVFGRWGREPAEEVVVCRLDPEVLEIHCHGGSAAVQRILDSLAAIGISTSSWQSQHAHSAGILATEFLEALSQARTLRAAGILLGQQQGIFRQGIERVLRSALLNNDESLATVTRQLDEILGWAAFGLHLTRPWKVVLTGRPNVGKSSLVNALLGYSRAIVSPEPGTTRDVVTGETAFDGWLVELSDTAGIRDSAEEIEAAGITRAHDQARRADALLVILDASQPPDDEDFVLLRRHPGALVVAHKADLPDVWRMTIPAGALRVSSHTGEGVDALATALVGRLVPRVPPADGAIPVTTRQIELLEAARSAADQGDCTRLLARLADLCGDR